MAIPLLSFFTGGGFLDIGFEKAGFDIIWTNEVNPIFADMYEVGMSSWRASQKNRSACKSQISERTSVANLSESTITSVAFGSLKPRVFGIIGGPPCPDFSAAGKDEGVTGERGKLTQVFIDLVCKLRPSFFVMENVPGLYRKKHRPFFDDIRKQLEEGDEGYLTDFEILSALELGVPQNRDRLFLIGFQKKFLVTDRSDYLRLCVGKWFPWPEKKYANAKKLPWPAFVPFGSEVLEPNIIIPHELTVNPLLTGNVEELPNGQDVFQPYSKKFWSIAEGDVSGKSFKRLHRYRYSPTVWYGNNEVHLHPWKPRRLSVREALRIQTVPDAYKLPQGYALQSKFKMIGNGVPCRMAEQLARSVMCFLSKDQILNLQI